ncbi:MAG: hypothetical protein ACQES8_06100 [Thermodesulfobacteriota bacterium]
MMAKKKVQKKEKLIHIELSIKGLLGLGVVLFCIFLWMFLLGIWVGQTVLLSDRETGYSEIYPGCKSIKVWPMDWQARGYDAFYRSLDGLYYFAVRDKGML